MSVAAQVKSTRGVVGFSGALPYALGMGKKKMQEKLKHRPLPLRLGVHRGQFRWSQAELGDRLETSDVSIGRIEGGKQNWNQEFMQEAARVLGVHWLDLLPLPGTGTILDIWAEIPPHERERALAALRLFSKKSAA